MKVYNLVDILIDSNILPKGSKIKDIDINNPLFKEFYKKNKDFIFQTQPVMPDEHKKKSLEMKDVIYKYETEDGYNYAMNGRRFSFVSDSINVLENGEEDLGLLLCDLWYDIDFQNTQNEGGISFPAGKKPEKLLKRLLKLFTKTGDVILDYHLGSGTAAAVAHKMGRKYIGIEQLDYGQNDSVIRLKNVINGEQSGISKLTNWQGGGSFIYCELAKANQQFAETIEQASTKEELTIIWKQMQETGFLSWKVNPKEIDVNAEDFTTLTIEDQKRFLIECLDKNLLYVPYSEIDNAEFDISEREKKLNNQFYQTK